MDMSMTTSTMAAITGMDATSTASSAMASSTGMDMSGMDMGGGGCNISMLWNWYTIDACFLSSTWHVKSAGAFAGSCIGVILLVMVLEALRRASREYDAYLIRAHCAASAPTQMEAPSTDSEVNSKTPTVATAAPRCAAPRSFTPNAFQQLVRALLHKLQFAVAYIIMLLATYFNGYIIISIFIGAFIGAFIFSWHNMGGAPNEEREVTYCCG